MINKVLLTTLFLLCVMAPKAQNLSFDLPFINESKEPELFFLDPNYNKDHQVEYYSLGNTMKVQYEYNAQHQPVKKTLYVMNQNTREWENSLETAFTYHNEQLIGEQSIQFHENKPIYTLNKTIIRHKNQHIDTIRTGMKWWNDEARRSASGMGEYTDGYIKGYPEYGGYTDGYTIRYLNQYNLPDSTLQVSVGSMNFFLKQYFVYNSQQQLIGGNAISKFYFAGDPWKDEDPWKDLYKYEVKHSKNKLEYIQTTNVPDKDEENSNDLTYDKQKTEITRYTITTDNNNRLLSKQLTHHKKEILNSVYNYNGQGQTNVTTELNLNQKFMKTHGLSKLMESLGLMRDSNGLKFIVSHDDNCINSSFYVKKKLLTSISSCYQVNDGKLLSRTWSQYNDYDGKDTYQYLADGTIEKTRFRNDSNELKRYKKYVYKKNILDRTIYQEEFMYSKMEMLWEPYKKNIMEYDQYGYLSLDEQYYKYESGQDWIGGYRNSWIRDAKCNILETINKVWEKEAWHNNTLEQYAYDENSQETLIALHQWDNEKNAWQGTSRDSFYIRESGKITGEISYQWLDGKWEYVDKKEFEKEDHTNDEAYTQIYNVKDKKTFYKWIQNQWEPTLRSINNKKEYDYFSSDYFSSDAKWDKEKATWRVTEENRKWRRGDTSYVEWYQWSDTFNQLAGIENTIVIQNEKDESTHSFFKAWDLKHQKWKDTISEYKTRLGSSLLYRYDKYNESNKQWEFDRRVEVIVGDAVGEKEHYITATQSRWNGIDWVFDSKIVIFADDETHVEELYTYQTANKVWVPLYCTANIDGVETSYLKWDQKNKEWAEYLLQKKGLRYWQWDESLQKYIESATAYENALTIDAEFEKTTFGNRFTDKQTKQNKHDQ